MMTKGPLRFFGKLELAKLALEDELGHFAGQEFAPLGVPGQLLLRVEAVVTIAAAVHRDLGSMAPLQN